MLLFPRGLFAMLATSHERTRRRRVKRRWVTKALPPRLRQLRACTHSADSPQNRWGPAAKRSGRLSRRIGRAVGLDLTETPGKVECGRRIAAAVGATWDAECYSRGDTITLTGLNRLLEGAGRLLTDGSQDRPRTDPVYSNEPLGDEASSG